MTGSCLVSKQHFQPWSKPRKRAFPAWSTDLHILQIKTAFKFLFCHRNVKLLCYKLKRDSRQKEWKHGAIYSADPEQIMEPSDRDYSTIIIICKQIRNNHWILRRIFLVDASLPLVLERLLIRHWSRFLVSWVCQSSSLEYPSALIYYANRIRIVW